MAEREGGRGGGESEPTPTLGQSKWKEGGRRANPRGPLPPPSLPARSLGRGERPDRGGGPKEGEEKREARDLDGTKLPRDNGDYKMQKHEIILVCAMKTNTDVLVDKEKRRNRLNSSYLMSR